jgi:hypothetical protein
MPKRKARLAKSKGRKERRRLIEKKVTVVDPSAVCVNV